jgi:hypothetical protein
MSAVKLSLALGRMAECPRDAVSNGNWLAMPGDSGVPGLRRPATALWCRTRLHPQAQLRKQVKQLVTAGCDA